MQLKSSYALKGSHQAIMSVEESKANTSYWSSLMIKLEQGKRKKEELFGSLLSTPKPTHKSLNLKESNEMNTFYHVNEAVIEKIRKKNNLH